MTEEFKIESIKRIKMKPGEVLMVKVATNDEKELYKCFRRLEHLFPDNKIMISTMDTEAEVVCPGDQPILLTDKDVLNGIKERLKKVEDRCAGLSTYGPLQ